MIGLVQGPGIGVESRPLPHPAQPPLLTAGAERLAVLALAAGAFVMALNANVMAALLPYLEEDPLLAEALTSSGKGQLVGIAGIAGAVGAVLLGPVVDKMGRRLPMFVGMLVFSLASFAHVFAEGFEALLWARAVAGFAGGVVYSSASAAVADLVPYERRAKAMGVFTAGMFLGLPVGLPLAGIMAESGNWQGIYWVQGALGLVSMVAIRFTLPAGLGKGTEFVANLSRLLRLEVFAALASVMLYVGAFFTVVQLSGDWMEASGILPKNRQWLVWLILGLCSALGSLGLGWVGDRIGKRRWANIATLGVAVLLLALSTVDGVVGLTMVGVPMAVIAAARTAPFQALISELVPGSTRGTLMGIRSAAVNLGTGVFPLLFVLGDYKENLYLAAGGVFVSFLLVQLLVKKR